MKANSDLLNEYKKIQEKFDLPQLESLTRAFQFELAEFTDIDDIRDEISERLFDFIERVVEPLIWSGQHSHIIERDMLDKKETAELFELYKKIQSLRWRNNLLMIKPNKEETAKWIKKSWELWNHLEKKMTKMCKKFSIGWEYLRFKKEIIDYNG
jgi:hypothetical protein